MWKFTNCGDVYNERIAVAEANKINSIAVDHFMRLRFSLLLLAIFFIIAIAVPFPYIAGYRRRVRVCICTFYFFACMHVWATRYFNCQLWTLTPWLYRNWYVRLILFRSIAVAGRGSLCRMVFCAVRWKCLARWRNVAAYPWQNQVEQFTIFERKRAINMETHAYRSRAYTCTIYYWNSDFWSPTAARIERVEPQRTDKNHAAMCITRTISDCMQ